MTSSKKLSLALGMGVLTASSALASGWDCTASCIGIYPRSGAMVLLGEPQATVGSQSATQAEAFKMLEDSCTRQAGGYLQSVLAEEFSLGVWHQDGFVKPAVPASACQSDPSIPDNDPPTVDVGFVPPGGIGG